MNLDNLEKGRMPSVVLFSNFVNYTMSADGSGGKITYMYQFQNDQTPDYEMNKGTLNLRVHEDHKGSTFELCTNFRFMPLCEFATRVKMKYDPDKNYCVFISDCDLTNLNAYYCMEEKTPLSCLPNYYITSDDDGQIYCSGSCINEEIRHPGNNQTQGICNSYCDKGTKQCPGTSLIFSSQPLSHRSSSFSRRGAGGSNCSAPLFNRKNPGEDRSDPPRVCCICIRYYSFSACERNLQSRSKSGRRSPVN